MLVSTHILLIGQPMHTFATDGIWRIEIYMSFVDRISGCGPYRTNNGQIRKIVCLLEESHLFYSIRIHLYLTAF